MSAAPAAPAGREAPAAPAAPEAPTPKRRPIDPRGPRFGASITSVLLAVALVAAPSGLTVALVAVQTVLFAVGATAGVQRSPYGWLFRRLVRPRLAPPADLEDPAPPRFAQAVGLVFAVVALAGFLTGVTALGEVAAGLALVAALLNAAFGFCLGCEVYLLARRVLPRPGAQTFSTDNRAGQIPAA